MRCRSCGKEVPEKTTICRHCDHILDKSFLGEGYTDLEAEERPRSPDAPDVEAQHPQPQTPGPPPLRPSRRRPRPPRQEEEAASPMRSQSESAPEESRRRRSAQDTPVDSSSTPSGSLSLEVSRMSNDVEGWLKKLWHAYQQLPKPDQLATGGSVALFVFSWFPWVADETSGAVIGLELGGWFTLLMAAATVALVYFRHLQQWHQQERYLLYAQIGVAALAVIFLLVQMSSLGSPTIQEDTQEISTPQVQYGLVLGFLSCLAILGGALLLLRERVLRNHY